jgi:hypothetical protein
MKAVLDHMNGTIRPALRSFVVADAAFMNAQKAGAGVEEARQAVMLATRQAAIELHHFSDFVLNNPSAPLPAFADLPAIRAVVQDKLIFLREPKAPSVDDVRLLHDVADAFKHHKLDRKNATVDGAEAIVMTGTGWGKLRWGEGKWGGAEQVIVERKSGDLRALSSVLQNVFDAWMTVLGQPLPPINQY